MSNEAKYKRIKELMTKGVGVTLELGKEIYACVRSGDTIETISDKTEIPLSLVRELHLIGAGRIHPKLTHLAGPGTKALRSAPIEVQAKYVNEPVEVVIVTDKGIDKMLLPVDALNTAQTKQVFISGTVRTAVEQRQYIEKKRKADAEAEANKLQKYFKKGQKIIVNAERTELTTADVLAMLQLLLPKRKAQAVLRVLSDG
jgi:hypothetical protein